MARTRGNSNKIQHRRGTASEWTVTNPILLAGELGYETDTTRLKFGDGGTQWTSLPYVGSYGAADLDGLSDVTLTSPASGSVLRYDGTTWADYVLAKADVGLGNADNTSDASKPVSVAQAAADAAVQAHAIQRANHTGTQPHTTITGLGTLATQSGTFSGTSSGTNTGDQTITLTGDVTGTGTGSFAATLSNSGVSAGTYRSVTVDAKGRVTGGTNPTTLTGYGITDAAPSASPAITGNATFSASSGVPITVTNTGTGNSFVVNDASGDTTPFVIDAGGSVGIGMTAPAHRLDVSGQIRATGAQDPLIVSDATNNQNNSFWFTKNGAPRWYVWNNDATNVFNIGNPTTNPCMTITTAGNVGIGTASPAANLDVAASAPQVRVSSTGGATGQLLADGSSFYVGPTGAHSLRLQTNGATRAIVDSFGNVTVGTTAVVGGRYFDIANTDATLNSGAVQRFITRNAANTGNTTVDLIKFNSGPFYIVNNEGPIYFGTGGVGERIALLANGNVGIGTASPATRLDVRRTNTYVLFCDSFFSTAMFGPREVNDGFCTVQYSWTTQANSGTENWQHDFSSTLWQVGRRTGGTFTSGMFAITSAGNVGIGTASPTISSGVGLHLSGSTIRLGTARTPASSTATGNTGEMCWDASYLYVCTATNTWRRIAHSTW